MNMIELLSVSSESSEILEEYRDNPQFYTLETLEHICKLRKQNIMSKLSRVMGKTILSITGEVKSHLRIAYNIKVILTQNGSNYLYINDNLHMEVKGDIYRWKFIKLCLYEIAADYILADPNFSPRTVRRFVYINNYRLCTVKTFDAAEEGFPFLMNGLHVYIKVSDDLIESLNCKTKESQTYKVAYFKNNL